MGFLDRLRGRPTESDFAAMMLRALRRAGETQELRHDRAGARILRLEGGRPVGAINLANMYQIFLEKPKEERANYLRHCVRSALAHRRELPEDFESARPDLRPKIWGRAGVEKQRLHCKLDGMAESPEPTSIALGEHLLLCLAYDWPESTQSVSASDLVRWGVTLEESLEAAVENLAETTTRYAELGEGVRSFVEGDSYDACRLLLVERILEFGLEGRPVAMVPNRDTVLFAGEDDDASLAIIAALATEMLEQTYRISGVALVLQDGQWVDWMPPPGHPLRSTFLDLEVKFLWPEYQEQKQLLEQWHGKTGEDVFVASYSAVRKQDGSLTSYCVWSEGVEALLPVTQKVLFIKQGDATHRAAGDWARVREVVGDLLEPVDLYPARYRVRGFPDDAMLGQIGQASL